MSEKGESTQNRPQCNTLRGFNKAQAPSSLVWKHQEVPVALETGEAFVKITKRRETSTDGSHLSLSDAVPPPLMASFGCCACPSSINKVNPSARAENKNSSSTSSLEEQFLVLPNWCVVSARLLLPQDFASKSSACGSSGEPASFLFTATPLPSPCSSSSPSPSRSPHPPCPPTNPKKRERDLKSFHSEKRKSASDSADESGLDIAVRFWASDESPLIESSGVAEEEDEEEFRRRDGQRQRVPVHQGKKKVTQVPPINFKERTQRMIKQTTGMLFSTKKKEMEETLNLEEKLSNQKGTSSSRLFPPPHRDRRKLPPEGQKGSSYLTSPHVNIPLSGGQRLHKQHGALHSPQASRLDPSPEFRLSEWMDESPDNALLRLFVRCPGKTPSGVVGLDLSVDLPSCTEEIEEEKEKERTAKKGEGNYENVDGGGLAGPSQTVKANAVSVSLSCKENHESSESESSNPVLRARLKAVRELHEIGRMCLMTNRQCRSSLMATLPTLWRDIETQMEDDLQRVRSLGWSSDHLRFRLLAKRVQTIVFGKGRKDSPGVPRWVVVLHGWCVTLNWAFLVLVFFSALSSGEPQWEEEMKPGDLISAILSPFGKSSMLSALFVFAFSIPLQLFLHFLLKPRTPHLPLLRSLTIVARGGQRVTADHANLIWASKISPGSRKRGGKQKKKKGKEKVKGEKTEEKGKDVTSNKSTKKSPAPRLPMIVSLLPRAFSNANTGHARLQGLAAWRRIRVEEKKERREQGDSCAEEQKGETKRRKRREGRLGFLKAKDQGVAGLSVRQVDAERPSAEDRPSIFLATKKWILPEVYRAYWLRRQARCTLFGVIFCSCWGSLCAFYILCFALVYPISRSNWIDMTNSVATILLLNAIIRPLVSAAQVGVSLLTLLGILQSPELTL
uniref:Transmembrane protein n=1 Tax=Chromera velia CCMP2878 TaxID=1169474 RepID=A0A0G4FX66_9ALVE|eukprot:Cvel_19130.t1-p1 / transcript=Cvel_19130.t1 / gene=Cvel_19130 / organism=Chromera_velia_CCMP2878 / gene_product=hypothetical protein / transcript_product=hypothetical protein / location=Cvel_scaffold1626:12092-15560(-) / protein_length=902 / sequence_SO=supercontig / SO=protein_coding / is_pseudo=false